MDHRKLKEMVGTLRRATGAGLVDAFERYEAIVKDLSEALADAAGRYGEALSALQDAAAATEKAEVDRLAEIAAKEGGATVEADVAFFPNMPEAEDAARQ